MQFAKPGIARTGPPIAPLRPASAIRRRRLFRSFVLDKEEAARLGVTIGMSDREIVSRLRKALDEIDDSRSANPKSSKEPK